MSILKTAKVTKISKQVVIVPTIMAILLVSNMPAAMGIYFITSSLIQSTQRIFI